MGRVEEARREMELFHEAKKSRTSQNIEEGANIEQFMAVIAHANTSTANDVMCPVRLH